jgi:HD superfamily phosphohydrolase
MAKKESFTEKGSQEGATLFLKKGNDILKTFKTIRIAVSGDVALNKIEMDIIDTMDFQRLRAIKALGSTYLVYPTAVHTRFDHSLGTLSMACEMMRAIRENKHNAPEEREITVEQEIIIRLLALLHDIGHVPFGHTIEDEFCIFERHDKDPARIERFLGKDSPIGKKLRESIGHELYERFRKIYDVKKEQQDDLGEDLFAYDLVNNTVCADLLDYLRRDCYFCNVVLDMDYRFLKFLYIRPEGRVKRLVVRLWKEGKPSPRRDLLNELIRLLDNRYLLGERVYFHHAKLVTGAMIAGAVQREKMEGTLKKEMLFEMGDETLLETNFSIRKTSQFVN